MSRPSYLRDSDAEASSFPLDWKVAYYRLHGGCSARGYQCPKCNRVFRGPDEFDGLHGDHIVPKARGGLTIWENLQLLCGPCNLSKSASS